MYENLIISASDRRRKDSDGRCGCIGICRSSRRRDRTIDSSTEVYTTTDMEGGPRLRQKSKFKVKHQKRKLFRANEPFFSVFMWGVNYSVVEVSHANVPVMLLPDDFKAFMKVKVDLQYFNQ
ncbi:hypothetical protein GJ496_007713 [Pomphorhynchus laevis]|nr:hypothetical protein GJ496_007713 [Pomphorhynchus laevis]